MQYPLTTFSASRKLLTVLKDRYDSCWLFGTGGENCLSIRRTTPAAFDLVIVSCPWRSWHRATQTSAGYENTTQSTGTRASLAIDRNFRRWDRSKLHRSMMGTLPRAKALRQRRSHSLRLPSSSWLIRTYLDGCSFVSILAKVLFPLPGIPTSTIMSTARTGTFDMELLDYLLRIYDRIEWRTVRRRPKWPWVTMVASASGRWKMDARPSKSFHAWAWVRFRALRNREQI